MIPQGHKRLRRARIIRTASWSPTERIVFVCPPHDELVQQLADYLGGRP
ncbi:MAG: hypothetical protein ACM358_05045 [Gemmatimonadota bacterium]